MGKRFAYLLLGTGIGLLVAFLLDAVLGKAVGVGAWLIVTGGSIAVAIAERMGKVKSVEEINRPVTLFPHPPMNAADKKESK